MKKLSLLTLTLLLVVAFTSCKSNKQKIVGTWKCTSWKVLGYETLNTSEYTTNVRVEFKENMICFTYSQADPDGSGPYEYTIDDSSIDVVVGSETLHYVIDELTDDRLETHGTYGGYPFTQDFDKL